LIPHPKLEKKKVHWKKIRAFMGSRSLTKKSLYWKPNDQMWSHVQTSFLPVKEIESTNLERTISPCFLHLMFPSPKIVKNGGIISSGRSYFTMGAIINYNPLCIL